MNLENSQKALIAIAVLLVSGAAVYLQLRGPKNSPAPTQTWFYDLNTGKLFAGPIDAFPPIPAPSGPLPDGTPAGVFAHVFACPTCAEKDRVIAYLETRTPEAQAKLAALRKVPTNAEPPMEIRFAQEEGILVRRPHDTAWVANKTREGRDIEDNALLELCPNNPKAQVCSP